MEHYSPELTLADYLGVLRRRWPLIVAVAVAAGAIAFAWSSSQPKQYRAQTQILMSAQTANQSLDPTASQVRDVARQLENELVFARSRVVADAVAEKLGRASRVTVAGQSKSADLLTFTAVGSRPDAVALAADTYAETFIALRSQRIVASSANTRRAIGDKLDELKTQRSRLDPKDTTLTAQRDALDRQIALYEQYTNGLDLMSDLAAASNAQVLSAAVEPVKPFSPTPVRTTALAVVVGLMLGVGLALLREYLDDRVRSKDGLERVTGAATTLAQVPKVSRRMSGDLADPLQASLLGETFRNLRAAVQFVGLRGGLRTLQVTSSRPGEGKSTVAGHLAVAMARSGTPVVLVDADLRRPMIANRFGLPNEVGLTSVMLGTAALDAAMQRVPGCPDLFVITSGPSPENAADFLWPTEQASDVPTFPAVLQELVERGFSVIVDAPPVLPVADALTIARAVDGTLFVTTAGVSRRRDITRALESLNHVDARVIGTVLNQSTEQRHGRYGYGYGYEPHGSTATRGLRRWSRKSRRTATAAPVSAIKTGTAAPAPAANPPRHNPSPVAAAPSTRVAAPRPPANRKPGGTTAAASRPTPAPALATSPKAARTPGANPAGSGPAANPALLDNLRAHLGIDQDGNPTGEATAKTKGAKR